LSSVEAEYLALTKAAKEAAWLQSFLTDTTNTPQATPIDLFYDNMGAGKVAFNPIFHARTKHIELQHHYI